jgi:hypothetical protein
MTQLAEPRRERVCSRLSIVGTGSGKLFEEYEKKVGYFSEEVTAPGEVLGYLGETA